MKIMEGIKQAVLEQKWELVCKIYTFATGEPLSPPKTEIEKLSELELPENFLSDKMSPGMIQLGNEFRNKQNLKNSDIVPNIIVDIPVPPVKQAKRGRPKKEFKGSGKGQAAYAQPINIQNRTVQFIGEGADEDRIRNNPQLGILYGSQKHNKNTSRKSELIEVECSICGKTGEVAPILAVGYNEDSSENTYKCNGCCSGKG